jgi:GxxExxY protein
MVRLSRLELARVTGAIVDAAIKVHSTLGPGLLESAYEACLAYELRSRDLRVLRQHPLPIVYHGVRIEEGYRIDLLVEEAVIVELKAVTKLLPIHAAQLLSYLRLSGLQVGLLVNFHTRHLRDGIHRVVNGY